MRDPCCSYRQEETIEYEVERQFAPLIASCPVSVVSTPIFSGENLPFSVRGHTVTGAGRYWAPSTRSHRLRATLTRCDSARGHTETINGRCRAECCHQVCADQERGLAAPRVAYMAQPARRTLKACNATGRGAGITAEPKPPASGRCGAQAPQASCESTRWRRQASLSTSST
jgi:hypothetical protein